MSTSKSVSTIDTALVGFNSKTRSSCKLSPSETLTTSPSVKVHRVKRALSSPALISSTCWNAFSIGCSFAYSPPCNRAYRTCTMPPYSVSVLPARHLITSCGRHTFPCGAVKSRSPACVLEPSSAVISNSRDPRRSTPCRSSSNFADGGRSILSLLLRMPLASATSAGKFSTANFSEYTTPRLAATSASHCSRFSSSCAASASRFAR
mmetsp:Transcript_2171/g.14345  ORF Transcript_2171/g.14345 Transcript_2171/m.14345 type:complete len:207 (-) Transcript_2171:164-784(-)